MKLKHFVGIWCNKSSSSLDPFFFYSIRLVFWLKLLHRFEKKNVLLMGWQVWTRKLSKSRVPRWHSWSQRPDPNVSTDFAMLRKTAERLHQVRLPFFPASILEQANGKLIHVSFLSLGPHYRMQHLTPGDGKEVQTEIISKYAVNQEPAKIRKVFFTLHLALTLADILPDAHEVLQSDLTLLDRSPSSKFQPRYDVSAGYQPHILLAVSLAMMLNFA